MRVLRTLSLAIALSSLMLPAVAQAVEPELGEQSPASQTLLCDVLVAGGGMSGVAASYEALLQGKTVCLTEITDWVGGQVSSQGTSALDETVGQRTRRYFPRGYLQFRDTLLAEAEKQVKKTLPKALRPGDCWVSDVCFLPLQGDRILMSMLQSAEKQGRGKLHWLPNTVIKSLQTQENGETELITSATAIQHTPQPNAPPLNSLPLSQTLLDSYNPEDSALFRKTQWTLQPANQRWIVIEATETGELLALADVPYRLGIDPRSTVNPSSSSVEGDRYCTQAITYTFAMAATATPQTPTMPGFYPQYEPFYSLDKQRYADAPALVFTYRRIWSQVPGATERTINPGDISMQNWGGGNDYGPGTAADNLLLTREQLLATGQLTPNQWQGGYRVESLRRAEELALGYFYWWVMGTTDSKLGPGKKQPMDQVQLLQGLDTPMGTQHGLSKFPYIRESRRIIGRPSYAHPEGFTIDEIDISRQDFRGDYYRTTLSGENYRHLITRLSGLNTLAVITDKMSVAEVPLRSRSRLYHDSVGIGQYPIDFHPCFLESPPEKPGNIERPGERQGAGRTYPYQVPLRAMIPQRIDNLIVTGKSIATSHISSASYRVHAYEWSTGAAAGTTAAFVLDRNLLPPQLIAPEPLFNPNLAALQAQLNQNNNPTQFPNMSIFNEDWKDW